MPAKKRSSLPLIKQVTTRNPLCVKDFFKRIKTGSKGGAPGQWSARKAQMLAAAYKRAGGGYR